MRVTVVPPSSRLSPWVRELRLIETDLDVERVLVPEPSVLLGFRFGGAAIEQGTRLPDQTVTGLRATARRMTTTAGGGMVLVAFRELGASAFLEPPLHELFGQTVPLDALLPRDELARASDDVRAARTNVERVNVVETFLQRVMRESERDALIEHAVTRLRGPVRIGDLAKEVGLSRDRLEKRFRRAIGTSPKHYASQVRLRHAMSMLGRGTSLTELAHEAGYFDQSHFVREFRNVMGEAPGRFFKAAAFC